LKKNALNYFKNQLYLLSDICYKNTSVLDSIKDLFQIPAIIHNLADKNVAPLAKIGLARMLTSLFENTENLIFIRKPKLQQIWEEDSVKRGRVSKFMTPIELEKMKELIEVFFTENLDPKDPSLHCEFLRFLSYLIRCDFVFDKAESEKDWDRKLKNANQLIYKAFNFCVKYLEILTESMAGMSGKLSTRSKSTIPDTDSEELPQAGKTDETISEEEIQNARIFHNCS